MPSSAGATPISARRRASWTATAIKPPRPCPTQQAHVLSRAPSSCVTTSFHMTQWCYPILLHFLTPPNLLPQMTFLLLCCHDVIFINSATTGLNVAAASCANPSAIRPFGAFPLLNTRSVPCQHTPGSCLYHRIDHPCGLV